MFLGWDLRLFIHALGANMWSVKAEQSCVLMIEMFALV